MNARKGQVLRLKLGLDRGAVALKAHCRPVSLRERLAHNLRRLASGLDGARTVSVHIVSGIPLANDDVNRSIINGITHTATNLRDLTRLHRLDHRFDACPRIQAHLSRYPAGPSASPPKLG